MPETDEQRPLIVTTNTDISELQMLDGSRITFTWHSVDRNTISLSIQGYPCVPSDLLTHVEDWVKKQNPKRSKSL